MNLGEKMLRENLSFARPPLLAFDLSPAVYPAILHLVAVREGKALQAWEFEPGAPIFDIPSRTLELELQLILANRGELFQRIIYRAGIGCNFLWPQPGQPKPTLARFERARFQEQRAVRLVGFEPPEHLLVSR
jgi:hypothetical protein